MILEEPMKNTIKENCSDIYNKTVPTTLWIWVSQVGVPG